MRIARSVGEFALLLAGLHWAYMLTMLGFAKWSYIGGILGLLFSAPLFPLAPFTAWLMFSGAQLAWLYAFLAVAAACFLLFALTKQTIVDESGRRL